MSLLPGFVANEAAPVAAKYQIAKSLRLPRATSAGLTRSFVTTGDQTKWTWSGWVKKADLVTQTLQLFGAWNSDTDSMCIYFSDDKITIGSYITTLLQTTKLHRDPNAWYHIQVSWDTTQATASERIRLWVNKRRMTAFTTAAYPAQNATSTINSASPHAIGCGAGGASPKYYTDGYVAEVHFVGGQSLDDTYFAEFDASGVCVPKQYVGGYGINGAYLPFSDGTSVASLGSDKNPNLIASASYNFTDLFDSFNGWTVNQNSSGGTGGAATVSGGLLVPTNYGTGAGWHGPRVTRPLPNLGDFDVTISGVNVQDVTSDIHYLSVSLGTTAGADYFYWYFNDAWDATESGVAAGLSINNVIISSNAQSTINSDIRLVRVGGSVSYYKAGVFIGTFACSTDLVTSVSISFAQYTTYPVPAQSVAGIQVSGVSYNSAPNHWNVTGVSLTTGYLYDWMSDTPTNNFPVLDALMPPPVGVTTSLTRGNLISGGASGYGWSSAGFPLGGKWYFEIYPQQITGVGYIMLVGGNNYNYIYFMSDAKKFTMGTNSAYGTGWSTSSKLGLTLDLSTPSACKIQLYIDNIAQGEVVLAFTEEILLGFTHSTSGGASYAVNFGQQPFFYTPPAGFIACCTANMGTMPIPNSRSHFDIVRRVGTDNGTNTIAATVSSLLFKPDWFLTKAISGPQSQNFAMFDSVRGPGHKLFPNSTAVETVSAGDSSQAFLSNGYVTGMSDDSNGSGYTFIDYLLRGGGPAQANNAGSIPAMVSANSVAGFSIATFTDLPSADVAYTIGHGLPSAPRMAFFKKYSGAADFTYVYHAAQGNGNYLTISQSGVQVGSTIWKSTSPTASVFTIRGSSFSNGLTDKFLALFVTDIPGFSKLGSYTGNGAALGPRVRCGFRPRWILIKRTDTTGDWVIWDTVRNTQNPLSNYLWLNDANLLEGTGSGLMATANGFSFFNDTSANVNAASGTYIYWAMAEAPFGGSNVSPANAF